MDTKFPSIEKLRHLVSNVQHNLGNACSERIPLIGTTKLHGAHVDVVIDASSNIRLQSRNVLDLTVENDVYGFAKWMAFKRPTMVKLRDAYYAMFRKLNPETPIDPTHPLILACEFIGKGIQKGVAIAQLDKRLVILMASINGTWLPDEPYADLVAEDKDIYHVMRGGVWHIDLDLQQPGRTEEEMQGLVAAVETECPFAKTFGIKGLGEGIVWKVADILRFQGSRYWCKTKGEKHAVSHTDKVDERLEDKEKLAAFADAVVTEPRSEQGWMYLEELGAPRDVTSIRAFVKWLVADCMKEEREEIKEMGVDEKKLRGAIAGKGSVWFKKRLEEG